MRREREREREIFKSFNPPEHDPVIRDEVDGGRNRNFGISVISTIH